MPSRGDAVAEAEFLEPGRQDPEQQAAAPARRTTRFFAPVAYFDARAELVGEQNSPHGRPRIARPHRRAIDRNPVALSAPNLPHGGAGHALGRKRVQTVHTK